jgi:WD40 repeat protein
MVLAAATWGGRGGASRVEGGRICRNVMDGAHSHRMTDLRGSPRASLAASGAVGQRVLLLVTCLAVAIGGMVAGGCGRDGRPASATATRLATVPVVTSARGFVDSLALSPDGSLAATGERGGQIRLWSTAGEAPPVSLGDSRHAVVDLAFAPNGRLLASLGRHGAGALRLWEPDERAGGGTWAEVAALPVERGLALRFDATGARLAVLCEGEVLVLDLASRRETLRIANPYREVLTAFDLSADGRRLVSAGHDGEVTVWDAVRAAPVRTFSVARSRRPGPLPRGLEPPEVWAVVVALSGDGSRAAAVTIEGTVYVWEVSTGAVLFDHADGEAGGPPPGSLRFGGDGALLAPTGDRYGMRRIDVGRRVSVVVAAGHRAYHTVAISADGAAFAVLTSALSGRALTYDIEVWRIVSGPAPGRG